MSLHTKIGNIQLKCPLNPFSKYNLQKKSRPSGRFFFLVWY